MPPISASTGYYICQTGVGISTWESPWTKEKTEVFHIQNDPINFRTRVATAPRSDWFRNLFSIWYIRCSAKLNSPPPFLVNR
ncbi:MAG: DUF1838 domain-containing protein [Pyrinomonadaceae bacterium]|nr:DUF1838 domain-containing protein [Pyrinomonadaceae bacterium]